MKQLVILNGFDRQPNPYLLVRSRFIQGNMTGNTNFPTPSPSLADLNATINSFDAAVQVAESGDRQAIAVRNQIRATLINQLHLLANYVLFTSAGNEVVAQSSGFTAGKQPEPRPAMTAPQGLLLSNGVNKGELQFSFTKVNGASAYAHEITESPVTGQSQWKAVMNTRRKNVFAGLESGREYNCRVAAIGAKQQVVYSDVVSRIVL